MCPDEFVTFLTSLAIVISNDKTADETVYLAVMFSQISASLNSIAAQKEVIEKKCNPQKTAVFIPEVPSEIPSEVLPIQPE
jgi:hypothetical protein